METELIQYLPDWYRGICDFEELARSETQELKQLSIAMDKIRANLFIQTMDEQITVQYETLLGIVTDYTQESLDYRRERILNRLSTKPPFTLPFLYKKLDEIIGKGRWTVNIDYKDYTLYVESSSGYQSWASEVYVTLNTIKPCHIAYINRPLLQPYLVMSESVKQNEISYHYHLGNWGLGLNPFSSITGEGTVVVPGQGTVQDTLLNSCAAFTADSISAVRINGTIMLLDFTKKAVNENTVTIAYRINNNQMQSITQVELLDTTGSVLTLARIYVPVIDVTELQHTIKIVGEGEKC